MPRGLPDPDVAVLLSDCAAAKGADYIRVRDELCSLGEKRLREGLKPSTLQTLEWSQRLTLSIILSWTANRQECEQYHDTFNKWIRSSYATVSGKPSVRSISGFCVRDVRQGNNHELLMLERLFKYDDSPHVKQGIVRALGGIGTEQSLDALIWLMKSPQGLCAEGATSVGNISRRLGDRRAVPDLVELYRTRPRRYGTGFPDEVLRALPPWPQVALASALRTIGGEEGLRALEELHRDETHIALKEQLERSITLVRERMENPLLKRLETLERLGDARAVPGLVDLYRTSPRTYGTGLPQEMLRRMAPWPQKSVARALCRIGGEEGLRALEELHADEMHDGLRSEIELWITTLRRRLEKGKKDEVPQTSRENPGSSESGEE
ncbi:MAG: HEAT repeat domain-containing protein [Phycisphaerales bacterium]|nr:MAG: HEAT repeat domain-containing protein [Phycisphaerales bacterium]